MRLGEVSKYKVLRETNIGYMLSNAIDKDDDFEYFLHKNETDFQVLHEDDIVNAFLYVDKMKRFALSLYKPLITVDKGGLVEAVSVTSTGTFFNIGISKDVLMSSDDYNIDERPKTGDKLPCKLRTRGNSIFCKLLNKEQILELNDKTHPLAKDENTYGYVYRITRDGINLVDEYYNIIFIHHSNLRGAHHLGEKVEFSVIGINENDYYGTCITNKENMMTDDSETVINYLNEHHGVMNYTEKTDALVLEKVFHMSKLAFKRAIGKLYKEEKIIITDTKIILKR